MCIRRGAKRAAKLCSSEGCSNLVVKKGVSCYSRSEGYGLLPHRLNNNLTESEAAHTNRECQKG